MNKNSSGRALEPIRNLSNTNKTLETKHTGEEEGFTWPASSFPQHQERRPQLERLPLTGQGKEACERPGGTPQRCRFSFTTHEWAELTQRQRGTKKKSQGCLCQLRGRAQQHTVTCSARDPSHPAPPADATSVCLPGALNDPGFQNPQVIDIFRNLQVSPMWLDSSLCAILCHLYRLAENKPNN